MTESKKEVFRVVKFVLFSISAGVIEFVTFTLLNLIPDNPYWVSYLIALVASVIWNFTLNRNFTFKSASNIPVAMLLVALFYLVFTPVSTILGNYLAETKGWNEFIVTIMNMAANLILEYLYDRFIVFRKSIDTKSEEE